MATVSVIVPNYNHARYLRKRVESLLRQTYQDFELILLDDCSTDESRSMLAEYAGDPRVRIEFNYANSGSPFKQWNKGVGLARGKFVWMAESDDFASERLLESLVAVLVRDERISFAYCRSWRVSDDEQVSGLGDWYLDEVDPRQWKRDFCMDGHEFCRKYLTRSPVVCNASAAVFRKAAYEAVGGADESLRLCGDWKLWAALALVGKVGFVSQAHNFFRYHASSVRGESSRDATDVIEKLQVIRWILDRAEPGRADLRKARQEASRLWVPAMMSFRVPLSVKKKVFSRAKEIDPHPVRRIVRPVVTTMRLKFARHWRELRSLCGAKQSVMRAS